MDDVNGVEGVEDADALKRMMCSFLDRINYRDISDYDRLEFLYR